MRHLIKTFSIYLLFISPPALADEIAFFDALDKLAVSTWSISDGWTNGDHQSCEWRKELIENYKGSLRLNLSDRHKGHISKIGCSEIQSIKRYSYGRFEAKMKTAVGSGLNTAFFTYIGPPNGIKEQDEIDFEFLGKSNDLVQVGYWRNATNYDVKIIKLNFDPSREFHIYAFTWLPNKIIWYVDGKEIHRSSPNNPIPMNPGKIIFSLWSNSPQLDDWMGHFTYSEPKKAEIEWVRYSTYHLYKD